MGQIDSLETRAHERPSVSEVRAVISLCHWYKRSVRSLAGEPCHRLGKAILVFPDDRLVALCAPRLAQEPAGVSFGEAVGRPRPFNRLPAYRGA